MKLRRRQLGLLAIFLLPFLTAAGTMVYVRNTQIAGQAYTYLADVAKKYSLSMQGGYGSVTLSNFANRLLIQADKRNALFNNIRIVMSYPALIRNGVSYLSTNDWNNTIEPLLNHRLLRRHRMQVIVLDPGHGGGDQGASGSRISEKNLTMQVTRRVAAKLRSRGYTVYQTRYSDVGRTLLQRAVFANTHQGDLFVAIHANSASPGISGLETFALTPQGAASSNGGKASGTYLNGHRFGPNNMSLAYWIHRGMRFRTGAVDRGVKRARFAVLRDVKCPGVLVEIGFLSNRAEERNLVAASYQDKIADGIVDGIVNYHRNLLKK